MITELDAKFLRIFIDSTLFHQAFLPFSAWASGALKFPFPNLEDLHLPGFRCGPRSFNGNSRIPKQSYCTMCHMSGHSLWGYPTTQALHRPYIGLTQALHIYIHINMYISISTYLYLYMSIYGHGRYLQSRLNKHQ